MQYRRLWDIFCKVIDNWGDVGVCWRLCSGLAEAGQTVRLWIDDDTALGWIAPQGHANVQVLPWSAAEQSGIAPGDVLVEAFGCAPATEFVAAYARRICASGQSTIWINLEYLTAEPYALRCHGLPSPVLHGPGLGLTKHFFYPGFEPSSGGLLREHDLLGRQHDFDAPAWLRGVGVPCDDALRVALFCYEPAALPTLMHTLASGEHPARLLITAGRSADAVRAATQTLDQTHHGWNDQGRLAMHHLPHLTQTDFDHLLWSCHLNCVRGEDSLVRALWAGQPLLWQAYPQHDGAHHDKLHAFLDWLPSDASLREAHRLWNSATPPTAASIDLTALAGWRSCVQLARDRLLLQPDLVAQLLAFCQRLERPTHPAN